MWVNKCVKAILNDEKSKYLRELYNVDYKRWVLKLMPLKRVAKYAVHTQT